MPVTGKEPSGPKKAVPSGPKIATNEPAYKPSPFSIDGIRSGALGSRFIKGFVLVSGFVMAAAFILPSLFTGNLQPPGGGGAVIGTAATVGRESISGTQLENAFQNMNRFYSQMGQTVGVTDYYSKRQQALGQLTDNAATVVAAKQAGVTVSDDEVNKKIDQDVQDSLKPPAGMTEAAMRRQIEASYGSMEKFQDMLRKNEDKSAVSDSLLVDKFEKQFKAQNKVTEDDYKRSVTKLKLWEIVIHPKFPSPSSKDFKGEMAANTKEAAARAQTLYDSLKTQGTLAAFQAAASKSSEDPATKAKKGDLGWKLPTDVPAGPDVGDVLARSGSSLVGPVADSAGNQYLFFIETRQTTLPKDYAKNKKKLLEDYETQQDNALWSKKLDEFKKANVPVIEAPGLSGYQIQTNQISQATGDDQKKLRQQALADYQQALVGLQGLPEAATLFQMAQIYHDMGDKTAQLSSLEKAAKDFGEDAQLKLELARALRESGKTKEAVAQLKAAAAILDATPFTPSPYGGSYNPNDAVRQQIAMEFDQDKKPALAAAQRAKVKPPAASPGGGGAFPGNIQVQPG